MSAVRSTSRSCSRGPNRSFLKNPSELPSPVANLVIPNERWACFKEGLLVSEGGYVSWVCRPFKERDAVATCGSACWSGAKLTFHVSFRPPRPRSYARGARRGAVGYAPYRDGVAGVASPPYRRLSSLILQNLSSLVPLLPFPSWSWRRPARRHGEAGVRGGAC
jgi:hypothetical protein